MELCRRLRAAVPDGVIVVLTARTGEFDVVIALDAGADDYLTKPFRLAMPISRPRRSTLMSARTVCLLSTEERIRGLRGSFGLAH